MIVENIQVRQYGNMGDYGLVSSWLERRGKGPLLETLLPATGLIVELDGAPAAAGWVYEDSSIGVGWFHNFVTNPDLWFAGGGIALKFLEGALIACARKNGYSVIFAHAVPEVAERFIRHGWVQTGPPCVPLLRRID